MEILLQNLLAVCLSPVERPPLDTARREWSVVLYFSCDTPGHGASRCPTLGVTFPFLLPEWKAEKVGSGYAMRSPQVMAERLRSENDS